MSKVIMIIVIVVVVGVAIFLSQKPIDVPKCASQQYKSDTFVAPIPIGRTCPYPHISHPKLKEAYSSCVKLRAQMKAYTKHLFCRLIPLHHRKRKQVARCREILSNQAKKSKGRKPKEYSKQIKVCAGVSTSWKRANQSIHRQKKVIEALNSQVQRWTLFLEEKSVFFSRYSSTPK